MIPHVKKVMFLASVPALQWNSHPHFLVYVWFKMKSNFNIFDLQEWNLNVQLQTFIQANITMGKKTLKTCQEQPHLLSGHFIKVFYKITTCPR